MTHSEAKNTSPMALAERLAQGQAADLDAVRAALDAMPPDQLRQFAEDAVVRLARVFNDEIPRPMLKAE